MNTKKIVISTIVALLGITLIFVFIWFIREQQIVNEAQLQKIEITTPEVESTAIKVFGISAQVREVRENSLLVDVLNNDFVNQAVREVLITSETVITKITLKDSQIYEREMIVYKNLIAGLKDQAEATGIQPEEWPLVPTNFIETTITFNQIEIGNRVSITANEDIRIAERFAAKSIKIEN